MKFNIPVGKILAGAVTAHGVIVSNYLAKAIKKTEDKPGILNTIAQSGTMALVTIPHMYVAAKLWADKGLNVRVGKDKNETPDDRFFYKSAKYMEACRDGKRSILETVAKLAELYEESKPETLLTKAFFIGNMNCIPELADEIRMTTMYSEIIGACQEEHYQKIYDWITEGYEARMSNDFERDGINRDQWSAIIALLDNTDDDPGYIYPKLVEVKEAAAEYMKNNGGIETLKVFETLDDVIDHFHKLSCSSPTVLDRDENDLNKLTAEEISKMTRDEVCIILLSAVQKFELQNISAVTLATLVAVAKDANPDGFRLFSDKWSIAADTANRVMEDVQLMNDPVQKDAADAEAALKKLTDEEEALMEFYQDIKDFRRQVIEGYYSDQSSAEADLNKLILRARANINIPRDTIKFNNDQLQQIIEDHPWTPIDKYMWEVDQFERKYDPDGDFMKSYPTGVEELTKIMDAIIKSHEGKVVESDINTGKVRMEAVIKKVEAAQQ